MFQKIYSKIVEDKEFLKHTSIMFVASLLAGMLNYVYQMYMGRVLGPEEYGVFGSLFAIFYILSVIASAIQTSGARFAAKFVGERKIKKINYLVRGLLKRMFLFGIVTFLFFAIFSSWIASFLNIKSITPVIIIAIVMMFSLLLPANTGVLQGLQKFEWLGAIDVTNALIKLLFGILLVAIGFGVNGALGALIVASAVAFLISIFPLKSFLKPNKASFDFSEFYRYSLPVIVASFCLVVPANVDVIIAKHFFDAYSAGLYTAASVLGKIVLFLPGAVVAVMFPKVSESHARNARTKDLLNRSLAYVGLLSGIVAALYWIFPSVAIGISIGSKYLAASHVLKFYGLAMFFFSLTTVFVRYCLAVNDLRYVYIFALFTLAEIVLLWLFHSSLMQLAWILLSINFFLFVLSYAYVSKATK